MLRELAELGMDLTRALVRQSAAPPEASEAPETSPAPRAAPRRDPADAFARLSRAVRLTLALEAKTDDDLAALRAGPTPRDGAALPALALAPAPLAAPAPEPPPARPAVVSPIRGVSAHHQAWLDDFPPEGVELTYRNSRPLPRDYPSAFRNEIRDSVIDVINREVDDPDRATEMLEDAYERLWEGERYDAFVHRPLKDAVAAICEDLGLQPDWSRWTENGWPPRPESGGHRWELSWEPKGSLIPKLRMYKAPRPPRPPPPRPGPIGGARPSDDGALRNKTIAPDRDPPETPSAPGGASP